MNSKKEINDSFVVVIPARYASTRLPGKPLLDIAGKPMIQRVYEQALQSAADEVVIATDDERIREVAESFGASVCMTRGDHASGTDRLQEVVSLNNWADEAVVVNVQGDEPLIPPEVINQVAHNLINNGQAGIATLCEPIVDLVAYMDPNAVKVVSDNHGMALYFSRAPIPWPRDAFQQSKDELPHEHPCKRHIGIYAYRAGLLNQFIQWPMALLEKTECLEQLRAMENGVKIHIEEACMEVPAGVDTQADIEAIRQKF